MVHYNFLRKNVAEASDVLAQIDFADNPNPVVNIDEFGWDYDGGIDQHTAAVLQAVHEKRPDFENHSLADARPRLRRSWRRYVPADGRAGFAGDLF